MLLLTQREHHVTGKVVGVLLALAAEHNRLAVAHAFLYFYQKRL